MTVPGFILALVAFNGVCLAFCAYLMGRSHERGEQNLLGPTVAAIAFAITILNMAVHL